MQFQRLFVPLASVALVGTGYHFYYWAGVAVATGARVMWLLLHFTRMMQVLKRVANRPIGYVGSTVMLNAKLKTGMTLLHVVAMTQSLGTLVSPKNTQPELYRWVDGTQSQVTCEFLHGKLKKWALLRPVQSDPATADFDTRPVP